MTANAKLLISILFHGYSHIIPILKTSLEDNLASISKLKGHIPFDPASSHSESIEIIPMYIQNIHKAY